MSYDTNKLLRIGHIYQHSDLGFFYVGKGISKNKKKTAWYLRLKGSNFEKTGQKTEFGFLGSEVKPNTKKGASFCARWDKQKAKSKAWILNGGNWHCNGVDSLPTLEGTGFKHVSKNIKGLITNLNIH